LKYSKRHANVLSQVRIFISLLLKFLILLLVLLGRKRYYHLFT